MTSWWNDKLKCQYKVISCRGNDKLNKGHITKCQLEEVLVQEMSSWKNDCWRYSELKKWVVEEMTSWINDKLKEWLVEEMTSWRND